MNKRLTSAEIESIVQSGEGYNAEFKIRVPNKVKELSEEICAFANSAGGILLIGVSDDNVIKGIEIDNGKRSAIQNSLNEINPHLPVEFYSIDVSGRTVWVIEVNTGGAKTVCFIWSDLCSARSKHPKAHINRANEGFFPAIQSDLL